MSQRQVTLTVLMWSTAVVVITTPVEGIEPLMRQDMEITQQRDVVDWICDEIFSEGICEMM